jgi:hypothetical protein
MVQRVLDDRGADRRAEPDAQGCEPGGGEALDEVVDGDVCVGADEDGVGDGEVLFEEREGLDYGFGFACAGGLVNRA